MRRTVIRVICGAVLLSASVAGANSEADQRNPFEVPVTAGNPFRYEKAIQTLMVKGIVRADGADRAIVRIAGIEGLSVLKAGDKIALEYSDLDHEFVIEKIRAKSVCFQPLSARQGKTAGEAMSFEVLVQ